MQHTHRRRGACAHLDHACVPFLRCEVQRCRVAEEEGIHIRTALLQRKQRCSEEKEEEEEER